MAFKLIVQNSKIVLKSVANYIINATGIKDLFTGDSSIDSNGKINWTLQHYVNTAANFTSANPTLLVGQIGIETDGLLTTPKFKIGNGVTAWNSLPYFSSGSGSTPSLQDVTDVGSTTTNAIDANGFNSKGSYIDSTGIYVFNSSFSGSNLLEVDRVNDIIRYLGVQVATVNDIKTKYKETFTYNGVDLTLANTCSFMYSLNWGNLALNEGVDYSFSGTTLTILNSNINNGDLLYATYE